MLFILKWLIPFKSMWGKRFLFSRVEAFVNKIPDSAKASIWIPCCTRLKLDVHSCVGLCRTAGSARARHQLYL